MPIPPLTNILEFALDAAWQAGKITLGYFQTELGVERKGDNSPVTIADRTVEQLLRGLIQHYWPDYGIIGEEFGTLPSKNGLTWTVDPIDGTKSFICGVPIYANLIALTDGTRPLVGVAHFPALNETIYATQGGGSFWNGRRARVSTVNALNDAVLLGSEMALSEYAGTKARGWSKLVESAYIRRTWGDAYGYYLVATGRADIMVDARMAIWDCGPLQVILEEAGGTFTSWEGIPTIYGGEAIATNGRLFDIVMATIKQD
ncbi:MAG: inositol monophosphatase family protein [Anaerolineae bacterium]